ncbi:multidrug effflux MFS transporter [Kineococcus sp. SYSU DK004]|uniref:multidrug effflux MFS transporter n=1 Tax=Kineococcus sp. SYSU DK004 TaxID=3383125 RepID=UPI003D7C3C0A
MTAPSRPPHTSSASTTPGAAAPARPAMTGRSTVSLIVLLGSMAALGAVTIDLYLPALPQVAADLGTTPARAQMTITGVLVGAALGQLLVGPLSDAFGRRRPAVIGFSVYVVACLLCAVAPNLPSLVAFRVLAGVGASAGAVIGMAVIRDLFVGPQAARLMSRIVLVIGVAPLFAPTVGGVLDSWWGWRPVLAVLAVVGVLVLVAVHRRLPETRPEVRPDAVPEPRTPSEPVTRSRAALVRRTFAGYGALLRDRRFLAFAAMPGLAMSVILSYVATSPFVLGETYELSSGAFAALFAVNGTALIGGSQLNAALVGRFGSPALLRLGVALAFAFALLTAAALLARPDSMLVIVVPLYFLLGSIGLIMPNSVTLALEPYGASAGSAAALVTAVQSGFGGGIGTLTGVLGGDHEAMAAVVVTVTLLNVVLLFTVRRSLARSSEVPSP